MKTTNQFHWGINVGKKFLATTLMITGISAISSVARAQDIASTFSWDTNVTQFSTLSMENPNSYTQAAINELATTQTNINSISGGTTMFGFTANNTYQTSGINGTTTLTLNTVGNYFFNVADIMLSSTGKLDINAPAGSNVVLDISGSFLVIGGQILVGNGLQPKNLLLDVPGTAGGTIVVSGGTVQGTILAPKQDVVIVNGSNITGKVFAQTVTVSSDTVISADY